LAFNLLLFCPGKHFSLYRALRATGSAQKIRLLCGLLFCLGQMEENATKSTKKIYGRILNESNEDKVLKTIIETL
jgi:hypothetical protein